jgi:hypothetical protein
MPLRYVDVICKGEEDGVTAGQGNEECAGEAFELALELAEGESIPEEVPCPRCKSPAIVTLGGKPRAWRGVPKTARDEHTGR